MLMFGSLFGSLELNMDNEIGDHGATNLAESLKSVLVASRDLVEVQVTLLLSNAVTILAIIPIVSPCRE